MADWKSYKGQGAWAFEKSASKPRYNEGSYIATSQDPTWDVNDFPGTPITPGHDPCGYWATEPYNPTEVIPPVPKAAVIVPSVRGGQVCWSGDHGGQYGRFVKIGSYSPRIAYSDDGGYTWTASTGGPATTVTSYSAQYIQGYFFASFGGGIYRSADGITWSTISSHASPFYSDFFGVLIAKSSATLYTSDNLGDTWTARSNVGLYNAYRGAADYLGKHYLFAYNYEKLYVSSNGTSWSESGNNPWSLTTSTARREAFVAQDGYLYYYTTKFDGTNWSLSGFAFQAADYKENLGYVIKNGGYIYWSNDLKTFTAMTGNINSLGDVCWGNDRWVAVGGDYSTGLIIGEVTPSYTRVVSVVRPFDGQGRAPATAVEKFVNIKGQVPWTI